MNNMHKPTMKYVCGFYFSEDLSQVVLIRKKLKINLEHFEGLLNGVGGKIETYENSIQAMVREFSEETGKDTSIIHWSLFGIETGEREDHTWEVEFYCMKGSLEGISTQEDEPIEIHNVDDVQTLPVIENLKYLIPAAITYLIDSNNA